MFPPLVSIILDVLRFVLAVTVLVGHVTQHYFQTQWPDLTLYGYAAVGSFFVLSGLVIRALESRAGAHSISEFYADRASRLLSVALPAVALTIVCDAISYRVASDFYMSNWGQGINLPLVRIAANLTFFSQPWGWDIALFSNSPFWSLGYESGFYVLWGLMVYAQRSSGKWWLPAIGALIYGPNVLVMMVFWFLGINLFELAFRQVAISRLRAWLPAIVAVTIMLLFSGMAKRQLFAGKDLFALFGLHVGRVSFSVMLGGVVTYIVLLPILLGAQRLTTVRISPRIVQVARFLGEATFPLYLVHLPILVLARSLHSYDPASVLQKLAVMLGIVLISAAVVPVASILKYQLRFGFRRLLEASAPYGRASSTVRATDAVTSSDLSLD